MTIQDEINEVIDYVVYLQIMASLIPNANFDQVKDIVISTNNFIRESTEYELKSKLPELKEVLVKMSELLLKKFPLKRDLRQIAIEFNAFFKEGNQVYTYGLEYGWLDKQMSLTELNYYIDTPYHFRIGLGAHRGNGSIEEDFLLVDAFNIRLRGEYYYSLLTEYGERLKESEKEKGRSELSQELYKQIAEIKFEVSAYSRLTIVSFYSFVECFVNSVGHSYLLNNESNLNEQEIELLKGFKKGHFISLKSKIEKFQELIRDDKKINIVVSDNNQMPVDFKRFFDYYEQLRNSAMHYSPLKETIWMKPKEWLDKAIEFSEISTKVALAFWTSCYPNSDGPTYIGKLNYQLHLDKAKARAKRIEDIESKRNKHL
jgi:hypothetical protein